MRFSFGHQELLPIITPRPTTHTPSTPSTAHRQTTNRTPSSGMRVFRIWRDDSYLALLLSVLGALLARHVAVSTAPTSSAFLKTDGVFWFL
jgi:hypothetical protein